MTMGDLYSPTQGHEMGKYSVVCLYYLFSSSPVGINQENDRSGTVEGEGGENRRTNMTMRSLTFAPEEMSLSHILLTMK